MTNSNSPIAATPQTVEHAFRRAVAVHEAGRLEEAGTLYQTFLQAHPHHPEANHNMGALAVQLNHAVAGLPFFTAALDADPTRRQFWLSYIDALIQADQQDVAGQILELAQQQGLQGAEVDELNARVNPDSAEAHFKLGVALHAMQRLDAAATSFQRALQLQPDFAAAHSNLGVTLKDLGRLVEAEASFRSALHFMPDYARAHSHLGATLKDLGRLDEAEASCRRALQINPDLAEAHCNLGAALQQHNQIVEAEACFRRALELNPDFAEAYTNLGAILLDWGRLVEAAVCYQRALDLAPQQAYAQQNSANSFAYLSDYEQVVAKSNAAQQCDPDDPMLWEQRLYTFSYHPDLSAQEIFNEFVRWGDRFPEPVVDFSRHDRTPGRRLRIGFVSPDFRRHTSRFYFWPMFENHDHAVVEMFAYSNVVLEDDATPKFKTMFDHWRHIRGMPDHDVARMIRDDRIDILVDGCNHMRDDRLGVFALKPAPVQATWLGAAWTTGLKAVDYVLFDNYIAPAGTLTRESIVRLPKCFIAYNPPDVTAPVVPTPALKNGYVTFGYSGRTERLNHHTFRVWGEILRRIPSARVILDFRAFADPQTQNYYRNFMTRHGLDANRVTLRNSANIFAGLNDFDVLLDSFPHNAGTMALDAFWMAVPMLTLAGRPPLGRIGATFMNNLGLPEWIAHSHDDYINKAIELTRDVQALAQLRAGMRQRMQSSPLMDGPGFARSMEAAYREMFSKWANP